MITVLILFHAENEKKESDEKNIKTRRQLDRDETVLMLATLKQGKSTLRFCYKSTRTVVDLYILRRRIRCRCFSLRAHLPPSKLPLVS